MLEKEDLVSVTMNDKLDEAPQKVDPAVPPQLELKLCVNKESTINSPVIAYNTNFI
jgi:hypothetical protein